MFVMVAVHFSENLAGYTPRIAGLGAPAFLFLVGVSYRLWLNGRLAKGASEEAIRRSTLRRGVFLFLLGIAFNVLVWLPEDLFNWDVLTLVGVAMITLEVARRLPNSLALLFISLVVAISPVARTLAGWPEYWTNGYFDPDWNLRDPLLGFLVVGYFPLFPWIVVPILGFVVGNAIFGETHAGLGDTRVAGRVAMMGGSAMALAALLIGVRTIFPELFPASFQPVWTMFPATTVYLCGAMGFVATAFSLLYVGLDRRLSPTDCPRLREVASTFSRHSLTAYLMHHVVHVWPLWIYGWSRGEETTLHWQKATSLPVALALAALFLPCSYLLFRWLDKTGRGGVESWMRRLCD